MLEIAQPSDSAATVALTVATRLHAETEGWSAFFDARCIPGVSACAVASCPWLGLDEVATLARVGLWICAVDELFESRDVDDAALPLRVEQYARCASVDLPAEVAYDPLALMLVDVAACLQDAAPDEAALELWRAELRSMLEAMIAERSALTDLDRYLRVASASVGVGFAVATGWILLGVTPGPRAREALGPAKRAVRLANDLRSWSRESLQGDANALSLASPSCVARRCRMELASVEALVDRERTRAAAFVGRFARVLFEAYAEADVRG